MQATPAPSSPPKSPLLKEPPVEAAEYPAPPVNTSSAPFGVLVGLFEKLQAERKHDRRRKLIDAWFTHWRQEKGYDLYPVLRLLLPQKDRDRSVYGLKEKNLAKMYIKLIPLGARDPDAIRLLNWKKPIEGHSAGDFAATLLEVVRKRSSVTEGSLSVDDVNDLLSELAKNTGKQDVQLKIMQRLYNRTTPEEQQWVARIILKDMIISVKETTILSVLHPDAQDLFNICSDLKKVAYELWDPSYRLNAEDKNVQLFHAFAPMLCKRPTRKIEETVREMNGAEFIIEEKLDGERMQLHKRGSEYFYCSRKGKDYTYLYGKDGGTGSLTQHIAKAFDPRVDDIILDGEMLVWDPVSERNLPFGTLKTAALDKSKKEHNPRPCFKVFDLLYLNGQSLLHRTTAFRKKNMRSCLKEVKGRLEFAIEFKAKTAKEVRERMDTVMDSRGEGLVIKHPLSKYILNGRNSDWIKVKPEYMDDMGETVDLLVVAGNYGSGYRSGGVSTLVCAVLDDRREYEDDEDPKYSSFVRIGTGLSFSDYVWIRSKPWKPWDPKNPPAFLQTAKRGQEDKGDVYLNPEDSFIIKIKAAEIIPTDSYHIGYTMRFPRAMRIRDDLSIADCMSASSVLESLRSEKKRKMEGDAGVTKKKRKTVAKKISVLPQYQGPSKKGITVESHIFEGLKFVVMSDPKSRTGEDEKKTLSKLIYANGGTCAQIVAGDHPELFVVYGGKITPYDLKLVIDKDVVDVLKPRWITNSVEAGYPLPMTENYFFHATHNRTEADDYFARDGDDMSPPRALSADAEKDDDDDDMVAPAAPDVKEEEEDPALAEWFKVDDAQVPDTPRWREDADDDDGSATEDDSDNADVAQDPEHDGEDDWMLVAKDEGDGEVGVSDKAAGKRPEVGARSHVKMGESADAAEYDQARIFRHLCFYLDTPANAARHGMQVKPSKHAGDIGTKFDDIARMIAENGGRVADLDEPRLTHVVVDKRDESRRVELLRRTAKPKRRHLVISEYIEACLDEGTLLDEDEFMP
ncbi:hypothetical protein HYPSUDRAFT_66273 [Hypholoma sublateritium FD-334 SS-4]|uniref:DNA ligase n=1 Tax=Hypholoma sublateritium (strain FD-334 SS-4) TaxID=945553 RepID=A0A0D2P4I9_HYPSF|nr:hypothetical protein HYPSUDRAFT_66273 [Hypholoma sublateritium FD-334 SS-4]